MLKKSWLATVFLLASGGSLFAQATATIDGRVIDQQGAVVPGASVTVTNAATGVSRDTVTNGDGLYRLPALTPGIYDVAAALAGFAPVVRRGIQLLIGATLSVQLELGIQVQETVTVTGDVPLVETTQSVLATSIRTTEVAQLPMLNRSLSAMMNLLPGAREVPVTVSVHGTSSNYVGLGGGSGWNYNMLVDGLDNKEDHNGGTLLTYSLEGVQEFTVLTSGSASEYGRSPQTVLLATKSGTNQLRSSVFGYYRNDSTIAIDYFSRTENGGAGVKPPFERQQYGASVGGPLRKDRAWFFGAIERVTQRYAAPLSDTTYNELNILERTFPNLYIKSARTIDVPSRQLMSQGKVNVQLNRAHGGWFRYSSQYGYVDNDFIAGAPAYGIPVGALLSYSPFVDHNHEGMWNVAGGWTWVMSPTLVNQFSTQYSVYSHDMHYPACPAPRLQQGVDLGVNACLPGRFWFPSVVTGPTFGGEFPLWTNLDNKLEFKDDLSKQAGRHALKAGIYYVKQPLLGGIFGGSGPGAIFLFDDPSVIANNLNGKYPQGFATPMPALILQASQTIGDYSSAEGSLNSGGLTNCQRSLVRGCAKNQWGGGNYAFSTYFQDDFKVSPRLTLNLGLRYDVYNYIGVQNIARNRTYQALKAIGSQYGALPGIDKNDWQPRLGIAWDVNGDGKNVLRASYGIYYTQGLMNTYFQRNFANQDVLLTYSNTFVPDFVPGVSPLPPPPLAPREFPAGAGNSGFWYDPELQNQQSQQMHVGWSHTFPHETVLAIDYTHALTRFGWRELDVNPVLPNGTRPLAADTQRVFNDPNLFGPVFVTASVNRGTYNELAAHFEHRFTGASSVQVNYALARAWGMGGATDFAFNEQYAQTVSAIGGDIDAPWEHGPTALDERHRLTVAAVLNLPFAIDVSPVFTVGSPRPYTQYRGSQGVIGNQGYYQILCPSGEANDIGFGVGQVPCGVNNARGNPLINFNARITKNVSFSADRKLAVFVEFFNILNRANFGTNYGNIQGTPSYNQPTGYVGGIAATSTVPISFQVQFGGRVSF